MTRKTRQNRQASPTFPPPSGAQGRVGDQSGRNDATAAVAPPPAAAPGRIGPMDVLMLAAWCGLAAGLLEVGARSPLPDASTPPTACTR